MYASYKLYFYCMAKSNEVCIGNAIEDELQSNAYLPT